MSVEQLQDNMEDHDPEEHDAVVTADPADPGEQPVATEEPTPDALAAADAPHAADAPEVADTVEPVAPADRAALLAGVPEVGVETEQAEASAEITVAFSEPGSDQVSIWPFVVYDIIWLLFAGVMVWQLIELPAGTAVYESGIYPLTLLGGLVLTAAGPVLIVATWLFERRRLSAASGQVFLSALFRGSVATLLGVAIWWAALIALDQLRLGRLF